MATRKQVQAAKRNVKKAQAGARRQKTISKLPAKTRTALGKQGAAVARRKRTGRLHVYTRAEKTGIAVVPLVAAAAVWILVPDAALRIVLIAMIVLVLPALVVVVLGRR